MLIALVCIVLLGVYGSGDLRFGGALALAAVMLLTLAFGLVGVATEPALLRLVAGAAFMFLALMFFLSFNDLIPESATTREIGEPTCGDHNLPSSLGRTTSIATAARSAPARGISRRRRCARLQQARLVA